MSFVVIPKPPRSPLPYQLLVVLIGSLGLFILGISLANLAIQSFYRERILPGISMAGVDLTNQTTDQAVDLLKKELVYPTNGRVVFRYSDQVWVASPEELGLLFDPSENARRAYGIGRDGNWLQDLMGQFSAWRGNVTLQPVITLDERRAYAWLQQLAAQVDQPMAEADLHLEGTQVIYKPGQSGRMLNVDATMAGLREQLSSFQDGEVNLVVQEQIPMVADASRQAEQLAGILSQDLALLLPEPVEGDPGPWIVVPDDLARLLEVDRVQDGAGWIYQVGINRQLGGLFLGEIADELDNTPTNARFMFNDFTRQLELVRQSSPGRILDVATSLEKIQGGLLAGEHEVELAAENVQPEVGDDATAASLGISELVHAETSYFRGSGNARLQNIKTAADQFYGLLIPPNTTFSMGEAIGDISVDNNYAEALIIYNGRTITGVGGGVCQVSTTLFRTVFFGGYPIVERHAHAYRVMYYEQLPGGGTDNDLAGMDATVYFPLVDLRFTNDRPYWLLMETYFNRDRMSLEWKFYSTNDGRRVEWRNFGLQDVVKAPEPKFEENEDLPAGSCKKVDYAADGASITVTRQVQDAGGQTLFNDTFQTLYEPWQAVYQYGPGTEDPQALAEEGACQ